MPKDVSELPCLEDRLGFLMRRAHNTMLCHFEAALRPYDLTASKYMLLVMIAEVEKVRTADLSRMLSIDLAAIGRQLDRLEVDGYVRRERLRSDRRVTLVELSAKGKKLMPELNAVSEKINNFFLRDFSKDELRQFKEMLRRLMGESKFSGSELSNSASRVHAEA